MTKIEIITDRIKLRLIETSDLAAIHHLLVQPETDEYNALGTPANLNETKTIIEPWLADHQLNLLKNYTFVIENETNQEFIGLFGLKLSRDIYKRGEVWYKILPKHWGNGYATEALKGVIDFSFNTLGLHRIQAGCAVENAASIKVLEKAGMIKEGLQR
ncbi:MAG: RimJ/RimL family protein N-acetyltransferase [Vicingaceae bacterium]|jgi:RimJ/RimL family protein N-acetyltransferase